MRKRTGIAATLACAMAMVAPPSALAECDTAVNCAIEQANELVADVQQTIDETKDLALATIADVQRQTSGPALVCVVQGRYDSGATGAAKGTGVVDCVRQGTSQLGPPTVRHGTFNMYSGEIVQKTTGPRLQFPPDATADAFTLFLEDEVYVLRDFVDRAAALSVTAHTGAWLRTFDGFERNAAGAFHVLPAETLDPSGAGDYFINGTLVLAV